MGFIYDLDPKHYPTLLATKELDIVDKNISNMVGEGKIPPDSHNRTILIGMGGTGVQTINHIKRVITAKLAPNWKDYIAFLAIDADENEFQNATHLTEEEFVRTTKNGIQTTINRGVGSYPKAWLPFVEDSDARSLSGYDGNGSGRKRLMGKMKIHYKASGAKGVDEDIVAKLADRKNNVLEKFAPTDTGHYTVYVIGSLSGGTCSGGFLEMPALIHKALNSPKTQIHAMLYLPDTLTSIDSEKASELMANGYASLKELDYYEGLSMREGSEEVFYYNDPANPELRLTSAQGFFHMPYLIGTRSGATSKSKDEACETIAEFFISILGRMVPPGENSFMVDSFLNNALTRSNTRIYAEGNGNMEAAGSDHGRPKRYGTVGFAQAAAPEQIIRAYTIAQACRIAGLDPIPAAERTARMAAGEKMLPFYGEDQFYSTVEVNNSNNVLLASLRDFMQRYQAPRFSYANIFGSAPTWEEIRDGSADDGGTDIRVNQVVEALTGVEADKQLQEDVQAEFAAFRNSVKAYVLQNGPMAFVNLYEGHAEKEEGGPRAIGIREVLNAMRDDLNLGTMAPNVWETDAAALADKEKVTQEIMDFGGGISGWVKNMVSGKKDALVSKWVSAYNNWVNTRVNTILRKSMLGNTGILNRNFIEPAGMLCQQLYAFGKLLSALSEGYAAYGKTLNNYDDFVKVNGGSAQVNIAALNHNVHAYLKNKAERTAKNIDGEKIRNALVESFFSDPNKWMEVDDANIERKGTSNQVSLVNASNPINARYEFDRCLRQAMTMTMEIRVEDLFENAGVDSNEFANQIINKLRRQSLPLFHGELPASDTRRYIMYPQSLKDELKNAIENAARTLVDPSIGFYGTDYADAIMMYQLVAPFELYALAELPEWENQYLTLKKELGNGLHGRSPDLSRDVDENGTIVYSENTTWFDYPAITYNRDPKSRDTITGEICHEGLVRIEMDSVIKEARRKGILYSQKTNNGWVIKRVHLDRSIEWKFDDEVMMPDEETGLMSEGKALLEEIITQQGKKLSDFSRVVRLAYAGLLSKEHSEEKWAWEYASRVLYVHRKMFIEIRDTLELTRSWYQAIDAMNADIKKALNPAKMYRLMQAGILSQSKNGMWVFVNDRGLQIPIANMNPAKLELLRDSKPREAAIVDTGLSLYYLFNKLMKRITAEELDEALERATEILNDDDFLDSDEFVSFNKMARSMLNTELDVLKSLECNLIDYNKPKNSFVANLRTNNINGKDMPVEIGKFYNKIQLWKTL